MQQHLRHDAQLRADARAFYNDNRLFMDQPPFDEAESRRTALYLESVASAIAAQRLDRSYDDEAAQLALI